VDIGALALRVAKERRKPGHLRRDKLMQFSVSLCCYASWKRL